MSNKLKKSLQFCMSFVLALSFLIAPFPKQTKKEVVTSAPSKVVEYADSTLLSYVTISTDGQVLTSADMKNVDLNSDEKFDES